MTELNRQQLCAALWISDSTVRRRELDGLPYTPVGPKAKRYNLAEVKAWLRENQCQSGQTQKVVSMSGLWPKGNEFTEKCRKVQLRVTPSC